MIKLKAAETMIVDFKKEIDKLQQQQKSHCDQISKDVDSRYRIEIAHLTSQVSKWPCYYLLGHFYNLHKSHIDYFKFVWT